MAGFAGQSMSDVTETDSGSAGEGRNGAASGKGRKRLLVIGAAAAGLLLAAGGGAWFLLQSDSTGAPEGVAAQAVHFYDLPPITVNLSGSGGNVEYLKLLISLEVRDPSMIAMIEPRMPRVMDAFQVYLRELRRTDLEGSAGIYRLKEELQRRVNLAIYPATVDNVLFKELLVQ